MDEDIEKVDNPMQRCIDMGDLDGVLAVVSTDEIARAWHRYQKAPDPKSYDHPDWWAVEFLHMRELFERRDLHRDLLLKLVAHGSEESLGYVGAGPVEDFVSDDEADLRWFEAECATNQRLRTALAAVWVAGRVSEDTLQRLDAAAGERLGRPRPGSEWSPEELACDATLRRVNELVPGGMAAYAFVEHPTEEQQAAVAEFLAAFQALTDR